MTLTREQAKEIHDEVMVVCEHLVDCLMEHKTPIGIGELALCLLAGTSAGVDMRPLTDTLIPTLHAGWQTAVERGH